MTDSQINNKGNIFLNWAVQLIMVVQPNDLDCSMFVWRQFLGVE